MLIRVSTKIAINVNRSSKNVQSVTSWIHSLKVLFGRLPFVRSGSLIDRCANVTCQYCQNWEARLAPKSWTSHSSFGLARNSQFSVRQNWRVSFADWSIQSTSSDKLGSYQWFSGVEEMRTSTATTTPEMNDFIGGIRKNKRKFLF